MIITCLAEGEIITAKPAAHVPPGALAGSPVSAGKAEGRARVILKLAEERDANTSLDLSGGFVHCVGAEQDKVRSSRFKAAGCLNQNVSRLFPLAVSLKNLYFLKVYTVKDAFCGMQAAQPGFNLFIDNPII